MMHRPGRLNRWCGITAMLLLLLLATVLLASVTRRLRTPEQFASNNSLDVSDVGDCIRVPVGTSPMASIAEKDSVCAATCNANPGYYTASKGHMVGGVNGSAMMCRCCDPATSVKLVTQTVGSQPCTRGTSFGLSTDQPRSIYVKDGCSAVFRWGDNTRFTCYSDNNQLVTCPYFLSEADSNAIKDKKQRAAMVAMALEEIARDKEARRLLRLSQDTRALVSTLAPQPLRTGSRPPLSSVFNTPAVDATASLRSM